MKYPTQSKYINKTEPKTNNAQYGSSFMTFYNITRGLVSTMYHSSVVEKLAFVERLVW